MSQAGLNNAASTPSIPTQFTTDSGFAVPAFNNLNVLGGVGIQTTGMGSTITIDATGLGFDWSSVTSATNPNQLVDQHGYIAKGGVAVQFTLPATAAEGEGFRIAGYGNLWTITQNAGQSIIVGDLTTTVGVAGSLTATKVSDTVEVICVTADTEFKVISMIGNPNVV